MGEPVSVAMIDRATLTPVVRKALRRDTVEVTEWEYRPIYGGAGLDAGIFRFAGHAHDPACDQATSQANVQAGEIAWALILKSIQTTGAHQEPTHYRYGLREVFAYQSGLLDDLPGGLAAPACYGIAQPADDTFWLWLEVITDGVDVAWSLESYGCAARHLGQFNGAYLVSRPLPAYRWLSRQWLRSWLNAWGPQIQEFPIYSDHPVHRRLTPPDVADRIARLWDELPSFLGALDRLPQTLCHLDAYNRNLFPQHAGRTIAIDWADMGIAAVGEEMGNFVASSLLWFGAELADAHELEQAAFAGYLAGLADAGWQGDARQARFGFVAASALRWVFFPFSYWMIRHGEFLEEVYHRPLDEIIERIAGTRRFLLELADEGRALLPGPA